MKIMKDNYHGTNQYQQYKILCELSNYDSDMFNY